MAALFLITAWTAAAEAAQLTLTWSDNSVDEQGFAIERRVSPSGSYGQIATVGANITTYTDTSVVGGTSYCFRARAYNAAGYSGYSNEDCYLAPAAPVTLTVTRNGTGSGTVTSVPSGVTCDADCSAPYGVGTVVTLNAAPASGSTFAGWSGACSGSGGCAVTMSAAAAVTATFNLVSPPPSMEYTLTVAQNGNGSGTVTSNPAGVACGSDCAQTYPSGTTVTLTAATTTGSRFTGWSGACTGTAATCTLSMTAARSATATFAEPAAVPHIITGEGRGGLPQVRGFDPTGQPTETNFLAYDASVTSGVFVALGDVLGTGTPQIVTGTGRGVRTEVRVYDLDGTDSNLRIHPYHSGFTGGARVATCDLDGDGRAEIVTSPGAGWIPEVRVYRGSTLWFSFIGGSSSMLQGLFIACGDLTGDGRPEIIVANGANASPEVRIYELHNSKGSPVRRIDSALAESPKFHGGVRIAVVDVDGDGYLELITGNGPGGPPWVRILSASGEISFLPYDQSYTGGVFVGGVRQPGSNRSLIVVAPSAAGTHMVRVFSVTGTTVSQVAEFPASDSSVSRGVTVATEP